MPPGRGSISATVPTHSTCLSASVRKGQIVSGVASITISRMSSAIMGSFVSLGGLGHVAQPFEAGRPVVVEEVAELAHLVLARLVQTPGAVASLAHEARRLEHPEVLRDRRARDLSEVIGDGCRREFAAPHQPQDLPAPGLCQCLEGRIHTTDLKSLLA